MSFLSRIFDRKRAEPVSTPAAEAPAAPAADAAPPEAQDDNGTTHFLQNLAHRLDAEASNAPAAVPGMPSNEELLARAAPQPAAAAAPSGRRSRVKTRMIGFEASDSSDEDPLAQARTEAAAPEDAPAAGPAMFPVAWVLVTKGPGRGASFPISAGMSPIGRGADQAVRLDFGDNAISRASHAAIVYDTDTKEFLLGHGGKSNIVRLNDRPVISNEALKGGDEIRMGETTLRLVTLADVGFDWDEAAEGEEDDDLEIA